MWQWKKSLNILSSLDFPMDVPIQEAAEKAVQRLQQLPQVARICWWNIDSPKN